LLTVCPSLTFVDTSTEEETIVHAALQSFLVCPTCRAPQSLESRKSTYDQSFDSSELLCEAHGEVRLLHEFSITRFSCEVELPVGHAVTLVKRLALSGRVVPTERVLEWFWPDESPDLSRRRLRNLLHRLHAKCEGLVERRSGGLTLGKEFHSDVGQIISELRALSRYATQISMPQHVGDSPTTLQQRLWFIRSLIDQILPDEPYDEIIEDAREELSRQLLVIERQLRSLPRTA
jgi:hypothetical protein